MDYQALRQLLASNAGVIKQLADGLSLQQVRWRPEPDRWTMLEVFNHLYDEEREDFRLHLDIMLHRPDVPWPPIDPMNWVTTRNYNDRNLEYSIANFLSEREKSLVWLDNLNEPDWESEVEAPWGLFKAGDMFASWVVHDQWHIQQLVQLRRDLSRKLAEPYSVQYAGSL